jgi:hypothetical protein
MVTILFLFQHVKLLDQMSKLYVCVDVDARMIPFPCELKREKRNASGNGEFVSHDLVTCTAKEIAPDLLLDF